MLSILDVVVTSASAPPAEYFRQKGWVLIAFHNALWQLLHAANLEEAVVDTVMRGGDTDTNAAICGALLGAVHGPGGHSRPMDGVPSELSPLDWKGSCFPPSPPAILAGGCAGVGGAADPVELGQGGTSDGSWDERVASPFLSTDNAWELVW